MHRSQHPLTAGMGPMAPGRILSQGSRAAPSDRDREEQEKGWSWLGVAPAAPGGEQALGAHPRAGGLCSHCSIHPPQPGNWECAMNSLKKKNHTK